MKTTYHLIFGLSLLLLFSSAILSTPETVTVYMIGDSTMANKSTKKYPEMGWGQAFAEYIAQGATVDNRAMDGRSTRSFIEEGRWKSILEGLKENDYVIIQFGHNDEKVKDHRGTTIYDFKENLRKFITETRAVKATPILLTPVTRRTFTDGKLVNTHEGYSQAVREIAAEEKVDFIDAHRISEDIVTDLGQEKSKELYLWIEPGEYDNYPEGKKDNTHFVSEGAHAIARAVVGEIKKMNISLSKYLK